MPGALIAVGDRALSGGEEQRAGFGHERVIPELKTVQEATQWRGKETGE
jgi:hypothetical protein